MLSVLVACAVSPAFASLAPLASTPAAADTIPAAPDLFDAPVYYERNRERYVRAGDLELLRAGRVRVQHYEPADVSEFAWSRAGTEYTWWMQMQEMRFLLPLIASERASDRALAREWLRRWFTTHVLGDVHKVQWGEPMTFAYRAMVFVYYLKTERLRAHPDAEAVEMLTTCILSHQQHLTPDAHFDKESNHGLIDALGLLETTRVFPNPEARELALHRIRDMVSRSLSAEGVHMEHAPAYHFAFLRWLDEILEYAEDVPDIDRDFISVDLARESAAEAAKQPATDLHDAWHDFEDVAWAEIGEDLPPEAGIGEAHARHRCWFRAGHEPPRPRHRTPPRG